MEEISDELFVKEMQILWQNIPTTKRIALGKIIRDYFGHPRAERIISRMQEKIE